MISSLLHPPESYSNEEIKAKYAKEAFTVLEHYYEKIDIEKALEIFPDSTPFDILFSITSRAIIELTEEMYNTKMRCNLTMSDYMEVFTINTIPSYHRTNMQSLLLDRMESWSMKRPFVKSARNLWEQLRLFGSATRNYTTMHAVISKGRLKWCSDEL